MNVYVSEFVGTALLLLLGNGVVANVVLGQTKGHGSGWIVITAGWGMAVFVAVAVVGDYSGAHINPAVTIGFAAAGIFEWADVPSYIAAQMGGAMVGSILVYLAYYRHFAATDDSSAKLAVFSTAPQFRTPGWNVLTEIIGTFALVFVVLFFIVKVPTIELGGENAVVGLGTLGALPVGLLVFAIGMSLGGPTGYAINPARDLGPRIMHAVLPIPGKGSSDWGYSWIPVAGPILGGLLAAWAYGLISPPVS
jgi:glycerol uptake facilitator protein